MSQTKDIIRFSIARLTGIILRTWRHVDRRTTPSGLVYAPFVPGSLGDMAMVIATAEYLRSHGFERVSIASFGEPRQWHLSQGLEFTRIPGWASSGFLHEQWWLTSVLYSHTHCFIVGADVMDGAYGVDPVQSRLLTAHLASIAGLKTTILGLSFSERATSWAKKSWHRLSHRVQVCVRDPQSYARLSILLRRPPRLVADVAFLLNPGIVSDAGRAAFEWVEERRLQCKEIIAINIGKHSLRNLTKNNPDLQTLDNALDYIADSLRFVAKENKRICFVLIPHDFREPNSDYELLRKIQVLLDADQLCSFLVSDGLGPKDVKALLQSCDLLFTGRMHAAIASIGVCTPTLALGYLDKFEGLFQMIQLPQLVVDARKINCNDAKELGIRMLDLLDNADGVRTKLIGSLATLKQFAIGNFDNV